MTHSVYFSLVPFKTPTDFILEVGVERRTLGLLRLTYRMSGDFSNVLWEAKTSSQELWQSTCWELFLKIPGQESYWECNFSPHGKQADYFFERTRTELFRRPAHRPQYEARFSLSPHQALYTVELALDSWPIGSWALQSGAPLMIYPTSILYFHGKDPEYWAPQHRGSQPDFHDPNLFSTTI